MPIDLIDKRQQLIDDGYCVLQGLLNQEMLARVREASERLLAAQSQDHFEEQKSTGSMISVDDDSFFAQLVTHPPALQSFARMGFDDPRWTSGFVISKPPHSPPLFWHQDWWGWNDPSSYEPQPLQLFLMYYLVDTDRDNGCLRVLTGSHRQRHPLHDLVPSAHTEELRRMTDPGHPAYQPVERNVDVQVKAGDLVIGDARLLHGTHANKSSQHRTVITLWYFPLFAAASEPIQAHLANRERPRGWSDKAWAKVQPLLPAYEGKAKPLEWNRIPDERLK